GAGADPLEDEAAAERLADERVLARLVAARRLLGEGVERALVLEDRRDLGRRDEAHLDEDLADRELDLALALDRRLELLARHELLSESDVSEALDLLVLLCAHD